jgi:CheY-like chemotaxis protein
MQYNTAMTETLTRKILVVDDNKRWFKAKVIAFKNLGATVVGAENVAEAIEALEIGGFTDIFTDGLDGE